MTIYKLSEKISSIDRYSGIIFDCDGVLIDSSRSYDLGIENCTRYFATLLGLRFDQAMLSEIVESIRELGSFNNDWDTLAVIVAYLYQRSESRQLLDEIAGVEPLASRLQSFETRLLALDAGSITEEADFNLLSEAVSAVDEGTRRDILIQKLVRGDYALKDKIDKVITYPKPVGQSFLATLFDEVVYGRAVFEEMYGFECTTSRISQPGLISYERKLVADGTLSNLSRACGGSLGIITGRPRVPTIHTLGDTFRNWFSRPEICLFTGDYLLEVDEVKPSPKPMLKIARELDSNDPILYVGDSGEDLLLVKNTNRSGLLDRKIYFAAIANSEEKVGFFESEGDYVDCIVSEVNELTSAIGGQVTWESPRV